MRDRLQSLMHLRWMRNVFFCFCAAFTLEAAFLLINFFVYHEHFFTSGILFSALAVLCGYLALYFHACFRSRE